MHIVFAPEFLPAFDFSLSLVSQYSTLNSIEQLVIITLHLITPTR